MDVCDDTVFFNLFRDQRILFTFECCKRIVDRGQRCFDEFVVSNLTGDEKYPIIWKTFLSNYPWVREYGKNVFWLWNQIHLLHFLFFEKENYLLLQKNIKLCYVFLVCMTTILKESIKISNICFSYQSYQHNRYVLMI